MLRRVLMVCSWILLAVSALSTYPAWYEFRTEMRIHETHRDGMREYKDLVRRCDSDHNFRSEEECVNYRKGLQELERNSL